jgi:hypothetical protein
MRSILSIYFTYLKICCCVLYYSQMCVSTIYNNRDFCQNNFDFRVGVRVWVMMFNATFNNISVISWRSVLLEEETGVPGENH